MRQVKLVLVALSFIGFFTISYSNLREPYKSDDGANNSLKTYGPLTVCADRVTYNSDEGKLTYYGDVFVMQIHNKHILCRKVKKPKKNYVYFTRDKKYTFKQLQEKWFGHAKEICADEKGCNFISGQTLTIKLDKDKKVQTLTMDTEGDEISQFYNYPVDTNKNYKSSKELTKGPLDGEGKVIVYDVVNKSLELNKKAVVNQNKNQYKGDKIIYDMEHDLINIPGSKNRRSEIVLDGIEGQTKLDTGLAPIADSNNKASAPMAS